MGGSNGGSNGGSSRAVRFLLTGQHVGVVSAGCGCGCVLVPAGTTGECDGGCRRADTEQQQDLEREILIEQTAKPWHQSISPARQMATMSDSSSALQDEGLPSLSKAGVTMLLMPLLLFQSVPSVMWPSKSR